MEEQQMDNVQPATDNVSEQESKHSTEVNDTVAYDSYRKAVGKTKRVTQENETLRAQLDELRQEKLAAEGKKDELIQELSKKNEELKSKLHSAVGSFTKTKALDVITDEGIKMGVTSVGLLKRAVEERLADLEYDEGFTPNRDQVKNLLAEIREQEPILFSKAAPKVADHNLKSTDSLSKPKTKKLSEMNEEELMKAWEKATT